MRLDCPVAELLLVEPSVEPTLGDELIVGSLLHDLAVLDREDHVGRFDRREPVRDRDRRPVAHQPLERLLDDPLALGVEGGGRLVEDQDRRVGHDHSSDRQPLALASREAVAALADDRVVAVVQRHDPLVDERGLGGLCHLLVGRLGAAVAEVVADGPAEQVALLGDHADGRRNRRRGEITNVMAVDPDRAAVDVIQPRDQVGDRRLAGTRRTDQRGQLRRGRRGARRH